MIPLYAARYWKYAVMGVLLIALAWTWNSRGNWRETAHRWQENAETWKLAYGTQQSAFRAAQAAAAAKFEAQRIKTESTYRILAERADANDEKITNLRSAAERYARANRVRNGQARTAGGDAGRAAAGAQAGTAQGGDGPGADAVILSRDDFLKLNDNTVQLVKVNKWADQLIAEGLAEKAE